MQQVYVWDESQDTSNVLTAHAAASDQAATIDGDQVIVPDDLRFMAFVMALGAGLTRAQFQSPSLRRFVVHEVSPFEAADEPGDPAAWVDLSRGPIELDPDEGLEFHAAESTSGADRQTGIAILADGPIRPIDATDIRTIRATGTTTLTASAWSAVSLTPAVTLPSGMYEIVGVRFMSAGAQAGRLIIAGERYRPGAPGTDAESGHSSHGLFRQGRFGSFGRFEHNRFPQAEFFSLSADTAETVLLDIAKVG